MSNKTEEIRESIRKNYAGVALQSTGSGCCGSGCCCSGSNVNIEKSSLNIGYSEEDISNAPSESNMGLGCGNPVAIASLRQGETVLDLGSGGGFDCFIASKQVGETGYVIGVDMTPEMIKLARNNADNGGYGNVEFRLGEIEHLPVADSSVDVIISNCVINLSLDKEQVYQEAYRVLKSGGRLKVSDIAAKAPLPDDIRHDLISISACIGGAAYIDDIKDMMLNAGFHEVKLTEKVYDKTIIDSWLPGKNIDNYVGSFDIEAIK
ncbi:MAG TPA: arsenite methyltransferase [Mobilitalea sp.]|nr:arsenite methyltransferase [Mobilitalea sp.]